MFGWLRKKQAPLMPESLWTVAIHDGTITVADGKREKSTVSLDELSGVAIETNDSGPWGADVWWLLFGAEDQLACAFPQGATGEQTAIDLLSSLAGFRHDEMINAMACTDNAIFPVWRKATV